MIPRSPRASEPAYAEPGAWAHLLVRGRLLHASVLAPTGQWIVQGCPSGPLRAPTDPADVLALTATIQHHTRSARPEPR